MTRAVIVVAVLLVSVALLVSGQWHDGDDDGCIEDMGRRGSGLCVKGNRGGWKGRKETCKGMCVNTGARGRDRCQCVEKRFGNRRANSGWNPVFGWGMGGK